MNKLIEGGIYKHYQSGKLYEVLGVSENAETGEELVVYKELLNLNERKKMYHMDKESFLETLVTVGGEIPRFEFVGSKRE